MQFILIASNRYRSITHIPLSEQLMRYELANPKMSVTDQVNQLKNENAYLIEQSENIKKDKARLELVNSDAEDEVQVQKLK